jgi:hypothetical protein
MFRNIELYFEVDGSEEIVKIVDSKIFQPRENCVRIYDVGEELFEKISWGKLTRNSCNYKTL